MHDVAFIALGSNLGDRAGYLRFARRALGDLPESRIVAETAIEETAPIGPVPQPSYLNQMIALETPLTPFQLLDALLAIERAAGRHRGERWGPRTLDLDIVTMDRQRASDDRLAVPHRELPHRDFWRRQLDELRAARPDPAR